VGVEVEVKEAGVREQAAFRRELWIVEN